MKKILMTMLILLIGLPLLGFASQLFATKRDRRRFPPPGRRVDVGGYRLHMNIMGQEQGGPTVLLDAGMVLVDGSHPDQWVRFGVSSKLVGVGNKVSGLLAHFGVFRLFNGEYKLLADGLPPQQYAELIAFASTHRALSTAGDALLVWEDLSRPLVNHAGSLGDMPLVVLSVTKQPRRGEQLTELQAELPALSSNSQHITVQGAYHEGLLSQQEYARFVTEAILQVVEALRAKKPPDATGLKGKPQRKCHMNKHVEQMSSQQFDQHMHTLIDHHVAPSLAVTAVRGSSIVVADGYGHPTLGKEAGASAETVYLYGSMTKLFTATAAMQLRERGLVELDRAVRDYVQDFPLRSASGREITARHLLSHSSGIANPLPIRWVHLAEEPTISLDDLTRRLLTKYSSLAFEPGSRYAYSNLGYLVLGQVVERVSAESFPQYMQRHILDVLDMHRTGFSFAHLQDEDIATGYILTFSLLEILGRFMLDRRISGTTSKGYTALRPFLIDGVSYGGLVGCVSDLGNFMQAYLHGGIFKGRTLLQASTIEEMFTPQRDDQGKEFTIVRPMPQHVGLGWHLNGSEETRYGYHLGDSGGFHTELRLYPQLDYGIAVCGNETSYNTALVTKMIMTS